MLDTANKKMEPQEINVKSIYHLYRQGVSIDSIANYYSLQKYKVKEMIAKGEAIRIYAEQLVAEASKSQLLFIGSILSKKSLSSQEKISKYSLQPKAFNAWEYAWENGLLDVAAASLATEMPMRYRDIKWSKDPEIRKLQEENERLKAELAYLKKKAELEEQYQAEVAARKRRL